jgi:hypothetical protein
MWGCADDEVQWKEKRDKMVLPANPPITPYSLLVHNFQSNLILSKGFGGASVLYC